jgi:hypothetical protein
MSKFQDHQAANKISEREISGGCHCQAIRFKAKVADDIVILKCNCSVCSMTGFEHLVVPHQDFELLSGQTELSTYTFNTGQAKHLFCKICGIKSFYQPRSHPDCWSINTHCVDDFIASEWAHQDFDGKNWQQAIKQL